MAWWDIFKRDVREFFTTSQTRRERRQCEFHLKVAEKLAPEAFSAGETSWNEYYDELGRAIAADTLTLKARWLRSQAAIHWFKVYRPSTPDPRTREVARTWDRDLKFILTHFPDREPKGMKLSEARAMREDFD